MGNAYSLSNITLENDRIARGEESASFWKPGAPVKIRKQILGIVIGIFLTMSFIAPAYSKIDSSKKVCSLNVQELTDILINVKHGTYTKTYFGYYEHEEN